MTPEELADWFGARPQARDLLQLAIQRVSHGVSEFEKSPLLLYEAISLLEAVWQGCPSHMATIGEKLHFVETSPFIGDIYRETHGRLFEHLEDIIKLHASKYQSNLLSTVRVLSAEGSPDEEPSRSWQEHNQELREKVKWQSRAAAAAMRLIAQDLFQARGDRRLSRGHKESEDLGRYHDKLEVAYGAFGVPWTLNVCERD